MVVAKRTGYSFFSPQMQSVYFVHVPKCGGSYITSALGSSYRRCPTITIPAAAGHKTYVEYRAILALHGYNIDDATSFAVVRNPWDWHVSWFHYIKGRKGGRRSGHWYEHELFQEFEFSDYIRWLDDPCAVRSHFGYLSKQVSDWVIDHDGRIAVTHILRQENLEQDFRRLVDELDLRVKVSSARVNASKHESYRHYYTDELIERIARRHERDLRLFGYTF